MNNIMPGTTIKHIESGAKYTVTGFEATINKPRGAAYSVDIVFRNLTEGGVIHYSLSEVERSIRDGETVVLEMPVY